MTVCEKTALIPTSLATSVGFLQSDGLRIIPSRRLSLFEVEDALTWRLSPFS
jgi:hypothetical protein